MKETWPLLRIIRMYNCFDTFTELSPINNPWMLTKYVLKSQNKKNYFNHQNHGVSTPSREIFRSALQYYHLAPTKTGPDRRDWWKVYIGEMGGQMKCLHYWYAQLTTLLQTKKGSPVHVAPVCAGSREWSDHFGSLCVVFPCISARGCFQDLNLNEMSTLLIGTTLLQTETQ
jgi:hypothetical protein